MIVANTKMLILLNNISQQADKLKLRIAEIILK